MNSNFQSLLFYISALDLFVKLALNIALVVLVIVAIRFFLAKTKNAKLEEKWLLHEAEECCCADNSCELSEINQSVSDDLDEGNYNEEV
ncbi:MAG: hypothetical protein SOZ40_06275 [Ezakiella sp.]|nr:hypothetical protein [Ezakiella sp.]MDD7761261.1 hypothetical protein [Bacillota bacterium]MDY3947568.1 hypothetical protein [Ezakiella sp.]